MLRVKQGDIKYHFFSLWTLVSRAIGRYSLSLSLSLYIYIYREREKYVSWLFSINPGGQGSSPGSDIIQILKASRAFLFVRLTQYDFHNSYFILLTLFLCDTKLTLLLFKLDLNSVTRVLCQTMQTLINNIFKLLFIYASFFIALSVCLFVCAHAWEWVYTESIWWLR